MKDGLDDYVDSVLDELFIIISCSIQSYCSWHAKCTNFYAIESPTWEIFGQGWHLAAIMSSYHHSNCTPIL